MVGDWFIFSENEKWLFNGNRKANFMKGRHFSRCKNSYYTPLTNYWISFSRWFFFFNFGKLDGEEMEKKKDK